MSLKSIPPGKTISPLVISNGFVYGWAFDPLRSILNLVLTVDGVDACTGLNGHAVDDSFYALAVPPKPDCGFCLPLPLAARDGRRHKLVVKVNDWDAQSTAPQADLDWFHGPCFGQVSRNPQGFMDGWVGFRQPQEEGKLPPVVVSDGLAVRKAIKLTLEPNRKMDGSQAFAKFRVERSHFADIVDPVFSCMGQKLPLLAAPLPYKVAGQVEVTYQGIEGWACNTANPLESLDLMLYIDDLPHSRIRPNVRRGDIARGLKLLPDEVGICGFELSLPRQLKDGRPHMISVRCKADGHAINPKPLHYQHKVPGVDLETVRGVLGRALPAASSGMPGSGTPGSGTSGSETHGSASLRSAPLGSASLSHSREGGNLVGSAAGPGGDSRLRGNDGSRSGNDDGRSGNGGSRSGNGGSRSRNDGKDGGKQAGRNIKPLVSIIILNRNGAACLDELFASLLRHNSVPVEFIVVDHASSDESLDVLQQWRAHLPLRIEALKHNYSFSASCNRGAQLAKAPYVLFLNNDIVWLQDALPQMLQTLESKAVGAVGLKLLKTEFAKDGAGMAHNSKPEVQHLGVRFVLHSDHYWPYEGTPDTEPLVAHYSPQEVPVVTGAVLLCRRTQFLKIGAFDEGYFYGYEDVELCLRMREVHGLVSVSRNDLVALHHHGYTRLTGREPTMVDHQLNNQRKLAADLGMWLKQGFWRSLLSGDGLLTSETFTVGFAVATQGAAPGTVPTGNNGAGLAASEKSQLAAALMLADSLLALYPHARMRVLTSDQDWDQVGECHVVVALSAAYDLRALKNARGDLRTAFYLHDPKQAAALAANPGVELFDVCLYQGDDASSVEALEVLPPWLPKEATSPAAPLGSLLDPEKLRVVVRSRHATSFANDVEDGSHHGTAVTHLITSLKAQGALVRTQEIDKPKAAATTFDRLPRLADVIITVFDQTLLEWDSHFQYQPRGDVCNVLWVIDTGDSLRPQDVAQADQVWVSGAALPAHLKKVAKQINTVTIKAPPASKAATAVGKAGPSSKPAAAAGKAGPSRNQPLLTGSAVQDLMKQLQNFVGDKRGRTFHTP